MGHLDARCEESQGSRDVVGGKSWQQSRQLACGGGSEAAWAGAGWAAVSGGVLLRLPLQPRLLCRATLLAPSPSAGSALLNQPCSTRTGGGEGRGRTKRETRSPTQLLHRLDAPFSAPFSLYINIFVWREGDSEANPPFSTTMILSASSLRDTQLCGAATKPNACRGAAGRGGGAGGEPSSTWQGTDR